MAANKRAYHPQALYKERIRLIRWYERHHPGLFDLYGRGWDGPPEEFGTPPRGLKRMAATFDRRRAAARPCPSWRGATDDKIATLSRYRFGIAYENAKGMPGYVTEKLLDCMMAGTVGVYWGPDNITDYVPAGCFVDRRAFGSTAELHAFLVAMDDTTYLRIQDECARFLRGPGMQPFSNDFFVSTLMRQIESTASQASRAQSSVSAQV